MASIRRSLIPHRHAVFVLADDLLLVFKPKGHREAEHRHDYGQRLRIVRGCLEVAMPTRTMRLTTRSRPLTLAARRKHATQAVQDTWLIVERIPCP